MPKTSTAVITFVYNESVNLPIWIRHYGSLFGANNLFIVDRGSDDGSTENLGDVNRLRVPRHEFDENEKTDFMSNFHRSLLSFYKTVIITDCDELLVTDPSKYPTLRQFVDTVDFDYVGAIGIDVLHNTENEPPINLALPILSQRKYGRFYSRECKSLISRIPLHWLPGFHSTNSPPKLSTDVYIFHTRTMDRDIAVARQKINQTTIWSDRSLARNFGAHHRFDLDKFIHAAFLVPMDMIKRNAIGEFEFSSEIAQVYKETTESNGKFHIPMNISKIVEIPERFKKLL